MLNERQQKLVSYIRQLNIPVTIDQLVSYFGKSERTIRNDIKMIQLWASAQDVSIHFKNATVYLDEETKQKLLFHPNQSNWEEAMANSPLTRQILITLSLLMSDETRSLTDIATQYNISKSTIASDMKAVHEWLHSLNIPLKSNKQGYFVEVKELQRRIAMINCLEWLEHSYMSTQPLHTISWANLSHKKIHHFEQIYHKYLHQFPQNYLPMYAILFVQYERIEHGTTTELMMKDELSISELAQKKTFLQPIVQLFNELGIELLENEQLYVSLIEQLYSGNINERCDAENKLYATNYIKHLQSHLSIQVFSNETNELLMVELQKILLWQQYELTTLHPLYAAVIKKYQVLFNVLQHVSTTHPIWQNIPMPMWTNIVLLLAGELELQQVDDQKIRAVLVCPNGSATSYFLEKKLQRYFQNIEIVEKKSVEELHQLAKADYDIIISTVLLEEMNERVVIIPPLLDEKQMDVLRNFIRNIEQKRQVEMAHIHSIFPNNTIRYQERALSIEQLLSLGHEILEDNGYVNHEVKQQLFDAYEKFGLYFEILPGVIMPHVLSEHVLKAGLSCICLKEPFVIGDKEIQTVITLVSPNEKEHIHLLQLLYELISKTKSGFELNSIIEKRDKTYAT